MCINDINNLLENNKSWVKEKLLEDTQYFKKLSKNHRHKYLWIGCSDARFSISTIINAKLGDIFAHRNVGNIVSNTDSNIQAVICYAVEHLKIEHIIVAGHYNCGAINAALSEKSFGIMDNWLSNIKTVMNENSQILENLKGEELSNKLSELNVKYQVCNVAKMNSVQSVWNEGQNLSIHGWVYNMQEGLLKDLNCTLNNK